MKVLIVDDKAEERYLLETLLKGSGYEVVSAQNGEEALEKLRTEGADMVVSDILMPVMDGFRFCQELRADKELKDLPFVFYTATYTDEKDEELALKMGADWFILKPIEPEEFTKIIKGVIKKIEVTEKRERPVFEEEKEVLKLYSERLVKKLEKRNLELQQLELKHRTLCENINDFIFALNEEGYFTDANCRAEMFGYTPEDVIGRHFTEFLTQKSKEIALTYFGESKKGISNRDLYEVEVIKKDGGSAIVELSMSTIYMEDKFIGRYGVVRDITQRKQTEEALRETEEQLRQSQKMEAIGKLAGGVAHDFNNLLTVIMGVSQLMLLDLEKGSPLKESIEEIIRAGERAASLTRQLLAFSRRQIMEFKVLDLNVVLKDLEKMLRRIIGEDIELMILMGKDLGNIKSDPEQVEQVVINLAVNARDAMPKGGKLIIETANVELGDEYIRSHIEVKPGGYVTLSVSDTGVGMTPEVRERVFEPFFTTKEMGRGTGLGLSTVYGIVKQSGGDIWVDSEPAHGTTFKVYLPRFEEEGEEEGKEKVGEKVLRGSETVLVVEDDRGVRKLAAEILKSSGYRILEASNVREALGICEKREVPIHVLLTDVVMPGASGRELADRLKRLRPEIKVLYMSGYTDDAIIHHGILEKEVNYIQKPFDIKGLTKKVREVLDK